MTFRRLLAFLFVIPFSAAGCAGLAGAPLSTLIPENVLPTVIELTAQALVDNGQVTLPPTFTIDPEAPSMTPEPSDTPAITATPLDPPTATLDIVLGTPEPIKVPDLLPQAEIQIISPGRLSRVLSPFKLHLYLVPPRNDRGEDLVYQVSLYGDDGRLINRETISRTKDQAQDSHVLLTLAFKIDKSAETVRLEISAVDPYGRISSMATTDIVLLSQGEEEIKAIQDLFADMIIQQPISSTLIQGNLLTVQGVTRIAPGGELLVECINRNGNQVGSAILEVPEEDLGKGYRPFQGEIPFQVGSSSWIRVQVIARDGQFSGIQSLTSVEVLVSP
jgi:hypothetical protein